MAAPGPVNSPRYFTDERYATTQHYEEAPHSQDRYAQYQEHPRTVKTSSRPNNDYLSAQAYRQDFPPQPKQTYRSRSDAEQYTRPDLTTNGRIAASKELPHPPLTFPPGDLPSDPYDHSYILHPSPSFNKISEEPVVRNMRSKLGLHPTVPIDDEHDEAPHQELLWSKIKLVLREPFAEFWGTFILIMFGDGAVAQVLLSTGDTGAPGGMGYGGYQSISWGWGIGIFLGIYVAGDSGAYLNPAVTFSSCLYRKLPWRRFPLYLLAQVSGAFVASGVVYANYINAINTYEGHGIRTVPPSATATAGIFCTYPAAFMTRASMFFSEFIASTLLMFVIFALKDNANMGGGKGDKWFPLALFFLIFGIGACFGWETGYAINLARDFGPRLMSYAVGYGPEVWSAGGYYFWIPMVAPFFGCAFGGFLYDAFIYTGESPVNTPWLGIRRIVSPREAARARRQRERRAMGVGMV